MSIPEGAAAQPPGFSIHQLLRADAFAHPVTRISLRETHISWVVLTGPFAYKIKKPVKMDFIDASTLDLRRRYCEEELRLNRRLAPDLYVDIVPITRVDGRLAVGADGTALEYAVRMRQFPAGDELPALLALDDVPVSEIQALAELLAGFHMNAPVAPPSAAAVEAEQMCETILANAADLLAHMDPTGPRRDVDRLFDWTRAGARELEKALELRARDGFIRECHGDLHAANIVRLAGRLVPFDCIEFDPRLRWIDVVSDIAFLVMDLASFERPDLAFAFLNRYLEITGDYDGMRLLPFYAVYRALVRAKVDAATAEAVPSRAAEFTDRLQRRVLAAMNWSGQHEPVLILMHGASGSGKSWLSGLLANDIPAVRLRSDVERKRLAGISPGQSAQAAVRQGIYSAQFSHRTYGHLADCAETCLRAGLNVIVDAAFLEAVDRNLFRELAARLAVPCVIVSCQTDPITLAQRVLERSARPGPSDANLTVLDAQLREIEPFAPEELHQVITIDTGAPEALLHASQAIRAHCSSLIPSPPFGDSRRVQR